MPRNAAPQTVVPQITPQKTCKTALVRIRPHHKLLGWSFSLGFLAILCAVAVVGETSKAQPFVWEDKSAAFKLPPSIHIWEGVAMADSGEPIRAWYADVDYNDLSLQARPYLSSGAKGREPVSQMARRQNALVAINGGYFDMQSVPSRTFSLVLQDNRVLVPNIARVTRPGRKYDVTRSAFGIRDDRTFDVAWIAQIKDDKGQTAIYRYDAPTPNTILTPAAPPSATLPTGAKIWNVQNAIGAGPTLVSNNQVVDTFENEVFFGSGFTNNDPYPRAAIGYTSRNHLILFATDGKQPAHSVGMSLRRLSDELQKIGCVEAMNLDGGGSETLVINGTAINHPSDGQERNVSSMLAIVPSSPAQSSTRLDVIPTAIPSATATPSP